MADTQTPDLIAWTDVETDGTDPFRGHLLELACIVTDTDLNEIDDRAYTAVLRYTPEQVQQMRDGTVPVVRDMHDKSGLWGRLTDGKPHEQVDAELYEFIRSYAPDKRQARLGGNSCRLDLNFVDEHLPRTAGHLHYRMIDVSTVCALAQWWKGVPLFEKKMAHEALSDIRESIAELRYLRAKLGL